MNFQSDASRKIINQKWNGGYKWHHRNTMDPKRLLCMIVQQPIGKPRRNPSIPRNAQPSKTEAQRNRKSE